MAFGIRLRPFGKKNASQTANAGSTPGSAQSPKQPKGPGLFRRASTWVGDTFRKSAREAGEIAQRTGQAVADSAVKQVKHKMLGLRIQHDLEALAVICKEEIATLRRKGFADSDALMASYTSSFTLADQLGRHVISYAEDLGRLYLAQFDLLASSPNSSTTSPSMAGTASAPAASATSALTTASNVTDLAILCPPLTLQDHRIMNNRYLKHRADELAQIYQQMLRAMDSIQRDLRKSRPLSELEMANLVRRLNGLVVYLLRREVAFGLATTADDSNVSAPLGALVSALNQQATSSAGAP